MKNPHIQSGSCAVVCAESKRDTQRGAALLEYALVVALVGVVGISGVRTVGDNIAFKFDRASYALAVGSGTGCDPTMVGDCTDPFRAGN